MLTGRNFWKISRSVVLILLILCSLHASAGHPKRGERLKVGLVLGGGGAKGATEVGVLKVIDEIGVPIDYIAGTSIGAIIGGLYSSGYSVEQLDSLFRNEKWGALFTNGSVLERLEDMVEYKDSMNFDELPIPFRCVATDIKNREEVVLKSGRLAQAMRASMAIPGAFKPVKIGGRVLVDGGMLNNLPVDVVRDMGADIVIAIDLTQKKHKTREFSLNKTLGIGGLLDWLVSRPDWKKHNENRKLADIYINPNLEGYSASDFGRKDISRMLEIGMETGNAFRKDLEEVKRRVMRKE
ncbi:MAG: patatin-like phospholipase family protein [Prevotella sp.]|uniref:patatin-like phospholipase family protein n=1 Tax=Prevotella sp. TaxID=59823 RepID=UPI002A2FAE86|nr:patatin-like phospholipase family protein [Prevotella sp.]MDD7318287.1 patatin-like phospholipase family protein [Prevotellaceae bacterium]MDY4019709.1 patatin-like phospholipase family protein [Prevotella sp.]